MEVGAGRLCVRDVGLGRQSGSGRANLEGDHGEADMRNYTQKSYQEKNLRVGSVWKSCLSMSSSHGVVFEIDEPRHADLRRRLSGVMVVAFAMLVVAVGARGPCHTDTIHASGVMGDAGVGVGINTVDAGAVGENGRSGERRKESRRKLSWSDSNQVWGAGKLEKHTQRKQMYSPGEQEDPEQKRGRREQESGMRNLDP